MNSMSQGTGQSSDPLTCETAGHWLTLEWALVAGGECHVHFSRHYSGVWEGMCATSHHDMTWHAALWSLEVTEGCHWNITCVELALRCISSAPPPDHTP